VDSPLLPGFAAARAGRRTPMKKTHDAKPPHRPPASTFQRVLKWVGSITAILSLFFGVYQLATMVSDARARARHIDEVYVIGKAQQSAGDFPAAWDSFGEAGKSAEVGGMIAKMAGKLDAAQAKVRHAQEDLAIAWLQDIHAGSDEKFSDTVDKLLPSLVRGAATATAQRRADLLAHVGWAYFLKSRDGMSEADPARSYAQAIASDAANPYAHAYWGHWILWTHGNLGEAMQHFRAAVASRRALAFVRSIELSALTNSHDDAVQSEFLRTLNEMHKAHEPIDAGTASRLYDLYYSSYPYDKDFNKLVNAVPAQEQIDLVRAVLNDATLDASKVPVCNAVIAMLQEAAGDRAAALAAWEALRAAFSADTGFTLKSRATAAIKRLSNGSQPASNGR